MPSRQEFATWLRVEVWISLVLLGLLVALKLLDAGATIGLEFLDGRVGPAIPYVVAGWVAVLLVSIWYAGRLAD